MITDEEIRSNNWILQNGVFIKENFLLKRENGNIIHIIRRNGNYPTVFKGIINNLEEFTNITKEL